MQDKREQALIDSAHGKLGVSLRKVDIQHNINKTILGRTYFIYPWNKKFPMSNNYCKIAVSVRCAKLSLFCIVCREYHRSLQKFLTKEGRWFKNNSWNNGIGLNSIDGVVNQSKMIQSPDDPLKRELKTLCEKSKIWY